MSNKSGKKLAVNKKDLVVVILGTTASGKTSLGVKLAATFDGEIISADSRQVYQGMDIGTGKDLGEYQVNGQQIVHHLIDVARAQDVFDLAQYQKQAFQALEDIKSRGKLAIIVGGSGLYLQAVVDNYELSSIKPDLTRRAELEKKEFEDLYQQLSKLRPEFAQNLNNSERHNKRRLIRYLELALDGEKEINKKNEPLYNFLLLGLTWPDEILRERITFRLLERLEKEGLVAEVKRLNQAGLSWQRLQSFGLEYKFVSQHLLGEISYQEMVDKLSIAIYRFAKRQKTWFKRWEKQGANIKWLSEQEEAEKEIRKHLV